jgi:hypothetical protein
LKKEENVATKAPAEKGVKQFKCAQCKFSSNTIRGLRTHQTRQGHHDLEESSASEKEEQQSEDDRLLEELAELDEDEDAKLEAEIFGEEPEEDDDVSSVHSADSPHHKAAKQKRKVFADDENEELIQKITEMLLQEPAEHLEKLKQSYHQGAKFNDWLVREVALNIKSATHESGAATGSVTSKADEAAKKRAEEKEAEEKEAEKEAEEYKPAAAPEAETLEEKCSRLQQIMYDAEDAKNSVSKRSKKYSALLEEFERARDAYYKADDELLRREVEERSAKLALEEAAREEKQKAEQAAREEKQKAEQAAAAAAKQARRERLKHAEAGPLLAKVKELKNLHNAAHTKMCEAFHAFKVSAECMTKDPALLNGPLRRAYNEAGEEEKQLESLLQKANDELEAFVEGR